MRISKAATRYAKSLLDFSIEKDQLEQTHADVLHLLQTIEGSKDLELLINSKVIQEDKKVTIYDKVFKGQISDLTLKFITLIAKNSRSSIIPAICEDFLLKYKVHKRVLTVDVISAVSLSEEVKSKLLSSLNTDGWNEVDLNIKVDPNIIGGIIFRAGGQQLDASVSSRLKELRKEFISNTHVAQL